MKRKTVLAWMLLILALAACQGDGGDEVPAGGEPDFFVHAGEDVVTRRMPAGGALSVSVPVADAAQTVPFSAIQPSAAALEGRYPEQVEGYGDITPFRLVQVSYDAEGGVVTSAYATNQWMPQAGSLLCTYDEGEPLVLEEGWLTGLDYLCDCCVLVLVRQRGLEEGPAPAVAPRIGASARVETVDVGEGGGAFVAGRWTVEEGNGETQTLRWVGGDAHWALRWRRCDWLFEIRAQGQEADGGFTFEDLVFMAREIDERVTCE